MKLDVPLVLQDKDSKDCGLAGLSMILSYYGIEESIDKIKESLKVYDGVGTYGPQLGKYLIGHGFDVETVTFNPWMFDQTFKAKSQEEILQHFETLYPKITKEDFKEPMRFFIEFMKAGGKVKVKIPDATDVRNEIQQDRPVAALLTTYALSNQGIGFNMHFNVVTGIDEKNIYVNDPLWDKRGGKQSYPINEYFYMLAASAYECPDNASLLLVKKK